MPRIGVALCSSFQPILTIPPLSAAGAAGRVRTELATTGEPAATPAAEEQWR